MSGYHNVAGPTEATSSLDVVPRPMLVLMPIKVPPKQSRSPGSPAQQCSHRCAQHRPGPGAGEGVEVGGLTGD
eukprot:357995-Chlamydomonas_euryale.AAC.7